MFNYGRWLWVAVILMAISTGIVAAQPVDYCISVRDNTNLRTSYSLNSRVWTIASVGTVLHVTYEGMQGNWLKVNYLDSSTVPISTRAACIIWPCGQYVPDWLGLHDAGRLGTWLVCVSRQPGTAANKYSYCDHHDHFPSN